MQNAIGAIISTRGAVHSAIGAIIGDRGAIDGEDRLIKDGGRVDSRSGRRCQHS